jgi:hypothetical protein
MDFWVKARMRMIESNGQYMILLKNLDLYIGIVDDMVSCTICIV